MKFMEYGRSRDSVWNVTSLRGFSFLQPIVHLLACSELIHRINLILKMGVQYLYKSEYAKLTEQLPGAQRHIASISLFVSFQSQVKNAKPVSRR